MSFPSTIILPLVGVSNPPSKFNKVDLPAPDGHKTTIIFPFSRFKFTSSKAFKI